MRIDSWTPERQLEWTVLCRAALDVKGHDFRASHKPPAKGIDFIASDVPLALESDSSTEFAFSGDYEQAREILQQMRQTPEPGESMALVLNDLAALNALDGELASAHAGFLKALEFDGDCI